MPDHSCHTPMTTGSTADESLKTRLQRAQWLRAAVLGACDGLLSTTSLMLGIGAAQEDKRSMILSGLAGAVAGACSMAVGEFVSVSTQRDIEKAAVSSALRRDQKVEFVVGEDALEKIIMSPLSAVTQRDIEKAGVSPALRRGQKLELVVGEDALQKNIMSPLSAVTQRDIEKAAVSPASQHDQKLEVEDTLQKTIISPLRAPTQRDIERANVSSASQHDQKLELVVVEDTLQRTIKSPLRVPTQRDIEKGDVSPVLRRDQNLEFVVVGDTLQKIIQSPLRAVTQRDIEKAGVSPASRDQNLEFVIFEDKLQKIILSPLPARGLQDEGQGGGKEMVLTSPYQAAAASALAFLCGSSVPLLSAMFLSTKTLTRILVTLVVTSLASAVFGGAGAYLGGSRMVRMSAIRVVIGGWISMAITYALLKPFDTDDD